MVSDRIVTLGPQRLNRFLVAGRAALPSIIKSLERLSVPTDPLAFVLQQISYKPYISLFNITGLDASYPELHGLREYNMPSRRRCY